MFNVASRLASAYDRLRRKRIAVTGLSGSGKTVLLVSLINHLKQGKGLPYFEQNGITFRAEEYKPQHRQLPRFPYEQYLNDFRQEEPSQRWPEHTDDTRSYHLDVELQDERNLRNVNKVRLEFIDYPGEKLVDLPLMDQDYHSWADEVIGQAGLRRRKDLSHPWLDMISGLLEGEAPSPEELVGAYREYLSKCWERNLVYIQPAELLQEKSGDQSDNSAMFCPLPGRVRQIHPGLTETFRNRYEAYRDRLRAFYRDVISSCSYQVVLVDLLKTLSKGVQSYNETKRALEEILKPYQYETDKSIVDPSRLVDVFRGSRIKKSIFVATQADRCARDRGNLKYLLEEMVDGVRRRLQIRTRQNIECYCCAAYRCTDDKVKDTGGDTTAALHGVLSDSPEKGAQDWEVTTRVPAEWPDSWEPGQEKFQFEQFCPEPLARRNGAVIPHLNLDKIIYRLLEDYIP